MIPLSLSYYRFRGELHNRQRGLSRQVRGESRLRKCPRQGQDVVATKADARGITGHGATSLTGSGRGRFMRRFSSRAKRAGSSIQLRQQSRQSQASGARRSGPGGSAKVNNFAHRRQCTLFSKTFRHRPQEFQIRDWRGENYRCAETLPTRHQDSHHGSGGFFDHGGSG